MADDPETGEGKDGGVRSVMGDIAGELLQNIAVTVVVVGCFALPMFIGNALAGGKGLIGGVIIGFGLAITAGFYVLQRGRDGLRRWWARNT